MNTDQLAPEFRGRLYRPAQQALASAGISSVEDLSKWTEADVLKLHGMGPKSIPRLRQALAEKGLAFADERTDRNQGT